MRRSLASLLAALLAGCAVTQPVAPTLDLPPGPTATAEQNELLEHWWTAFDDPVLSALIEEAYANNLDLKVTLARIEAAQAQVLLAQYYLYPNLFLNAGASRNRYSQVDGNSNNSNSPSGSNGSSSNGGSVSNTLNIGFQASYEVDLWGKYRSSALASTNDLVASRYYRETVRISVAAEVARAYFQLRAADALLVVLKDTRKTRGETVTLQRDRFEGGRIGEYDLRQGEAELSAVEADIARAEQSIGLLESGLATLTGRPPREVFTPVIARGATIEVATAVPQLPEGLPSGLLARRPDIRRAEALLASSELRIQQARADYFPNIQLTGTYGFEGSSLANLFSVPALAWSLAVALVQPILALKPIEAAVMTAEARRDQTTIEYAQTVQIAFRDVHDALVVNGTAQRVLAAETFRRDQLKKALEVATLRYDAGRTSFLEVLDAQRTLLAAETLRIAAARDARISIVDFARAIGGGWKTDSVAAVN